MKKLKIASVSIFMCVLTLSLYYLWNNYNNMKTEKNNNEDACLFCSFSKKNMKCYTIWEDENHMAFLSIYPNTPGVTVVIPKKHLSSYIFDHSQDEISALMQASKHVQKIILENMPDVGRVAVIFEGFGIDHLHAKLFPMHGTSFAKNEWKNIESNITTHFNKYEGYVSSHDVKSIDIKEVEKVYNIFIKKNKNKCQKNIH